MEARPPNTKGMGKKGKSGGKGKGYPPYSPHYQAAGYAGYANPYPQPTGCQPWPRHR